MQIFHGTFRFPSTLEIVLLVIFPFGNRIKVTFRQINELDVRNRHV